jgi:hypothetical protein
MDGESITDRRDKKYKDLLPRYQLENFEGTDYLEDLSIDGNIRTGHIEQFENVDSIK